MYFPKFYRFQHFWQYLIIFFSKIILGGNLLNLLVFILFTTPSRIDQGVQIEAPT